MSGISIIIPTKNRQQVLSIPIASFLFQNIQMPMQFIIIDQSDKPATDLLLSKLLDIIAACGKDCELNYIHAPHVNGLTQAKNVGISKSRYTIITVLDDDMVLLPGFVENVLKGLHQGYDAVSGVQIQDVFSMSIWREIYKTVFFRGYLADNRRKINRHFLKYPPFVPAKVLSGGLTVYKKKLFEKARFDERLRGYCLGEDFIFSRDLLRAGAKIAICTRALAFHLRYSSGHSKPYERFEAKSSSLLYICAQESSHRREFRNYIFASWALFGVFVDACITSLKMRSFEPLAGYVSGIQKSLHGFKGLPYIKGGR